VTSVQLPPTVVYCADGAIIKVRCDILEQLSNKPIGTVVEGFEVATETINGGFENGMQIRKCVLSHNGSKYAYRFAQDLPIALAQYTFALLRLVAE